MSWPTSGGTAVTFMSEWDYEEWEAITREIGITPSKGSLRLYGQH